MSRKYGSGHFKRDAVHTLKYVTVPSRDFSDMPYISYGETPTKRASSCHAAKRGAMPGALTIS
jgi:hypothetical protein